MAIKLEKGQRINLEKESGAKLEKFCVGCNWGAIVKKGFFSNTTIDVDLDLSCIIIDSSGDRCDHIYSPLYRKEFLARYGLPIGKLISKDGAMRHTGDDLEGDKGGDDGLDNEIITVDLTKVDQKVAQIFFFLNNCGREDFSQIPYATIRMFEGTPEKVEKVFASYSVSANSSYASKTAIIMGELYKNNGTWKFNAIGDAFTHSNLGETTQDRKSVV